MLISIKKFNGRVLLSENKVYQILSKSIMVHYLDNHSEPIIFHLDKTPIFHNNIIKCGQKFYDLNFNQIPEFPVNANICEFRVYKNNCQCIDFEESGKIQYLLNGKLVKVFHNKNELTKVGFIKNSSKYLSMHRTPDRQYELNIYKHDRHIFSAQYNYANVKIVKINNKYYATYHNRVNIFTNIKEFTPLNFVQKFTSIISDIHNMRGNILFVSKKTLNVTGYTFEKSQFHAYKFIEKTTQSIIEDSDAYGDYLLNENGELFCYAESFKWCKYYMNELKTLLMCIRRLDIKLSKYLIAQFFQI